MYLGEMGLSLKPPKWLRDLGAKVISGTRVTVQTPLGPFTFDPSNPAEVARLRGMLSQTQVTLGPTTPTPLDRAGALVDAVPGGIGTIALAGGAALALLLLSRGRR